MNELDYQLKVQKEVAYELNLKEKVERLQSQLKETQQELKIRINDNADMYANLCNALMQLEEANQIIKWYNSLENLLIDGGWQLLTGQKKGTAEKYLKKWSVE